MCPDYLAGFCELGPQCEKGHPKWNIPEDTSLNEPQYDAQGKLIPNERPREKSLRALIGMPMAFPGAPLNTRKTMDEIRCLLCHQTGHFAAACPNVTADPSRPQREISSVLCYRCGEHGHYANVCVNPRREPPPGGWPGAKPQVPRNAYAGMKRPHE